MCPQPSLLRPRRLLTQAALWAMTVVMGGSFVNPLAAQSAGPMTFQSSSGLKITIASDRPDVSDDELAQALEQAALRLRGASAPIPANPFLTTANPNLAAPPRSSQDAPGPEDGPADHRPKWVMTPTTLLWTPPLANPWEPRFTLKPTSLTDDFLLNTLDTAIGGTMPLLRYEPAGGPIDAWQSDFYAVVFSRWAHYNTSVAVDYRFGFPLSFQVGNWQGKIGFDHTSTHLGDRYLRKTDRPNHSLIRDEVTFGLGYRFWDQLRFYGQGGYAVGMTADPGDDRPWRLDAGVEWCAQGATGPLGKPFAAVDVEARGEQNYAANFNGQIGWMWRGFDNGPSLRVALEYFDGHSPFGQFYMNRESWVGLNVSLGF